MKTWVGIDGGASGAIAAWHEDQTWEVYPADTKQRALTYVRQRCADLAWLEHYSTCELPQCKVAGSGLAQGD